PQWVRSSFEYLSAKDFGQPFARGVAQWTNLERSYGWQTSPRGLAATHRPDAVGEWLRVLRRDLDKSPVIKDEVEYANQWWAWWGGLQPNWRSRDDRGRPIIDDSAACGENTWEGLRKPGANGVLMVLLSLCWWREIATPATLDAWQDAVMDVTW
ncbi:hypothetical protein C8Q76DRAFT_573844, partial [Earliella scabrosa]